MGPQNPCRALVERLEADRDLTGEQFYLLLTCPDPEVNRFLAERARGVRERFYGRDVYLRGLIEFTSYCKNNCRYCGIRRGNACAERYRLSREEILACAETGWRLGFRTFVLQGGEDPYFTDERLCGIVEALKRQHPEAAITLSVGERDRQSYQRLYDAGQSAICSAMRPPTGGTMNCCTRGRCLMSAGCSASGNCGRSVIRWAAA